VKYILEYYLFRTVAILVRLLPLRVVRWFGVAIGYISFYVIRLRRSVTIENLRLSFPQHSSGRITQIARESYVNLAITILEMLWIPRLSDDILSRELHIENPELVREKLQANQGVLVLSGHIGNWELMAYGVGKLLGFSYLIVVHSQNNPRVRDQINAIRTCGGNRVVDMRTAGRAMLRALGNNEWVALLADQSAPRESIYVDFFGRPASTFEGPAVMALKTRVPLLMCYCIRQEDYRYRVWFEELAYDDLVEFNRENVRALTERHVKALERVIARHPGQWLWQHRRWKHRPSEH